MSFSLIEPMLERIAAKRRKLHYPMQPPASPAEIEVLQAETQHELGAQLPQRYAEFLSIINGLDDNGLRLFATSSLRDLVSDVIGREVYMQGLVEENQRYRLDRQDMEDILVLGEDEAYLYAQNLRWGFYVKWLHSEESPSRLYDTFDAMFYEAALRLIMPAE